MTAAVANKDTPEFAINGYAWSNREIGVAAATKIYAGTIVALDASGNAVPATTATGLVIVGVAQALADNTSGAAGAIKVKAKPGVYKMYNLGADAVDANDLGRTCYVTDDQTVSETDGGATKSPAGKVFQLDSDGVWVAIGFTSLFA
jgi:hypothetical protein